MALALLKDRFGGSVQVGLKITESQTRPAARALIADDQSDVREALRLLLKGEGYLIEAVQSPAEVLASLGERDFDLLLMDLNYARDTTSGQEGLDLLARIQALDSTLPVVVMTAWGTVPLAVEAMRRGVRDFVEKPWDNRQLLATLRAQIRHGRALRHKQLLEEEKKQEMEEAIEIEQRLVPQDLPQIPGYEMAAAWQPAHGVGGDYFDGLKFAGGKIGLAIGDVMGKGMPAALLMSNLQAAVRAFASEGLPPQELCEKVNRVLSSSMTTGRFVSFHYCLLDANRKMLSYSNAGHLPPILWRRNGAPIRLEEGGAVLGVFPDGRYAEGEAALQTGDRLVLFTDGVTEACNAEGEEFGPERLARLLAENSRLGAAELKEKIMAAVTGFSSGAAQDDATLMIVAVE
ncbi:MAG: SpoIIE family protein phosphatase, partial [Acidobacteria bacterium]|nr:SpoIIE family protein phosphatase [Acidobacteriota bacterium]